MNTHTTHELVKSVSIANVLSQRSALLERLEKLFADIDLLDTLGKACHAGPFADWFTERHGYEMAITKPNPLDWCRKRIDFSIWEYLMNESGVYTFMNKDKRDEWRRSIREGKGRTGTQHRQHLCDIQSFGG